MKLKVYMYIYIYILIGIYIFTKYITKGGCDIAAGDELSFTNASFKLGGRSMRNGQNRTTGFYSIYISTICMYVYLFYMYVCT